MGSINCWETLDPALIDQHSQGGGVFQEEALNNDFSKSHPKFCLTRFTPNLPILHPVDPYFSSKGKIQPRSPQFIKGM